LQYAEHHDMFDVRVVNANVPKGGDILKTVSPMLAASAWIRSRTGAAQTHTPCTIA